MPMKSFIAAAVLAPMLAPMLALAGCSSGNAGGNATTAAAPVAAKAAPAGQSWTDTVVKTAEGYRVGNPDAPVKVAEYGSRLCPTCGAFAREAYAPLMKTYVDTGKVSLEFREFLVHGAPDLPPSLLGTCVPAATFFPLLEAMYANQQSFNDKLIAAPAAVQDRLKTAKPVEAVNILADTMGLVDFVKQRGLPEAKARACLADMGQIDRLTKQTQDRTSDGTVTGTPTFLINGKVAPGVITWGQLEPALKAAGA